MVNAVNSENLTKTNEKITPVVEPESIVLRTAPESKAESRSLKKHCPSPRWQHKVQKCKNIYVY